MGFDTVILGGGIIGALCAYECAKQGQKVALFDKHQFGHGASGRSAAMLERQLDSHRGEPFLSLAKTSHDLFPLLYAELLALTGIDFQLELNGILEVAMSSLEAESLKQEMRRQTSQGFSVRWITPSELKKECPSLQRSDFGAIHMAEDGQVNGEAFLNAALQGARHFGAKLEENVGEVLVQTDQHKNISIRTSKEMISGSQVVLAAGAWSEPILLSIGLRLGLEPVRGQLVIFETPKPLFPFPIYTKSGGYIACKQNGTTVAGTTVENVGFDSSVTDQGKQSILAQAFLLAPLLQHSPVKGHTAGLRPKPPDGLPFIGVVPNYPQLIVAAGHFRNGVLLAPVTAKIVSALAAGLESPVDISPFSVKRKAMPL